jgi:hypothetical protein
LKVHWANQLHPRLKSGSRLDTSDGESEETFRNLQSVLSGKVEKAQLDALSAEIGDFDFSGALGRLDELAQEIGLNQTESASKSRSPRKIV